MRPLQSRRAHTPTCRHRQEATLCHPAKSLHQEKGAGTRPPRKHPGGPGAEGCGWSVRAWRSHGNSSWPPAGLLSGDSEGTLARGHGGMKAKPQQAGEGSVDSQWPWSWTGLIPAQNQRVPQSRAWQIPQPGHHAHMSGPRSVQTGGASRWPGRAPSHMPHRAAPPPSTHARCGDVRPKAAWLVPHP